MIDRLPHVREPSSGEPDVCVHCLEEWVDLLTLYERDECSVRLRAALDAERAALTAAESAWRLATYMSDNRASLAYSGSGMAPDEAIVLLGRLVVERDEARAEASRLDALVNVPGECNSILKLRAERNELALTLANERDECSVRLRAALDAERATVAALRASVPPLHPADYGHEAWTVALVEAKKEGARSAVEERAAERVAVVAWLRAEAYLTLYEATPEDVADCIERGEHRREETE